MSVGHALAYAKLGWHVLPLKPGAKVPLRGQGLKHATRDEKTISAWWRSVPDAGIGIALAPSGLVAVDVDPRNGGDIDLRDRLPATLTAATGGGGLHMVYRVPVGADVAGQLQPGVDLKYRGYIAVEPSLHPSGKRYAWLDFEPLEGEIPTIAEAPPELLRSARPAPASEVRATSCAPIAEGRRNAALTSIAGKLRRSGLSADAIEAALQQMNSERCAPPLPEDEVRGIARSVGRYAPAPEDDPGTLREQQRQRAQAIGDGTADGAPLMPLMSLDQMIGELVFVADGSRVARRDRPHIALPVGEFKLAARASETRVGKKMMPTVDLWVADPLRVTTHTLTYRPGHPEFTGDPEGAAALNLWRPRERKVSPASAVPFVEHVAYLVPEADERERFLNWLAHIEQQPGLLPHTHYLMVTPQTGIGRNWLASLLARVWSGATRLGFDLVGAIQTGFNGGLSRRLLVIVDELKAADTGYGAGQHAQALKAMLTTEHRAINPKYGRQHVEFNCARWLMFSQHYDALPLERADRRVIVVTNPSERKPPAYYASLYQLLDNELFINAVANWLAQRDIRGFNPSEPAPATASKAKAIEANMTDIERALIDLRDGTTEQVMTSAQIGEYLADCGVKQVPPRALSTAYAAVGLMPCRNVVRLHGRRHRVVALRDGEQLRDASAQYLLALLNG